MVNEIHDLTHDEYGLHMKTSTIVSNLSDMIALNDYYSRFVNSVFCTQFRFDDRDDGDHKFVAELIFGGTIEYDVVLRVS